MKTDFIATISHELRTPLTTIQGGIEYLFKVLKKNENIEFLSIIDKNLKNLILMVNNLIDIARIELGKLELEITDVNLKEMIEEAIILFKGFAHEKNVLISMNRVFDCIVDVDRRRINQVFINVFHNAIKYSPENDIINVSMEKADDNIKVKITNTLKSSITEKDVSKFFIKYKYLSAGKEKGSGLGLAIAKAIMEAHKGKIDVSLSQNKITFILIFQRKTKYENTNS
jgi:signal transduction histidine kinase